MRWLCGPTIEGVTGLRGAERLYAAIRKAGSSRAEM
jgi:hypothetical protein